MREVTGAIERPSDSAIEINESLDGTWIRVPPPRLPWIVYACGAVAAASMLVVIVGGALVLLFDRTFPGYNVVVGGHLTTQPLAWRLAGVLGWLTITPALTILMASAARPFSRFESIFLPARPATYKEFEAAALLLAIREFGLLRTVRVPLPDVLRFELHHDPQGLMESEIVIETLSALEQGSKARRSTVAGAASESEKEWLASVLNALLRRAQPSNATS